jgi:ribonuclease HI
MALDPSQGIALYTDGSAYLKDKSGGWAYVALDAFDGEQRSYGAASDATNNTMEMTAVINGLCDLRVEYGPLDVLVISDSEYVIKGATEWLAGWERRGWRNSAGEAVKNKALWITLASSIDLHNSVEFQHVKGHAGDHYNEIVDDLAGRARKGLL